MNALLCNSLWTLLWASPALCALPPTGPGGSGFAQDPLIVLPAAQSPASAPDAFLATYEIADLTGARELHALPPLPTHASGLTASRDLLDQFEERLRLEQSVETAAADLVEAIESYITPKLAKDQQLRVHGRDKLLALLSKDQHEWLRAFLEQQREDTDYIQNAVKLLSVPAGTLEALGVVGASKVYATDVETSALLRALEMTKGVETITSPLVTTKPRQLANISVINQVAYIKDYKLEIVQPGDQVIADPVIDVVQDGVVLEVRCVPLPEGQIGLDFNLNHSKLARPIETMEVSLSGYGSPVTISLPQVSQIEVHTRMILAPGATALIVTPDQVEGREMAVLIKLERLNIEDPALSRRKRR